MEDIEGIQLSLKYKVAKYLLKLGLIEDSFTLFIYLNTIKKISNIYRQFFILGLLFLFLFKGNAQEGFSLPNGVEKDKISFQLINNLVVIPVEVNGTILTFLLDTGVSSTIMFSLSSIDSLALNNSKSIRLRGLGEGGSISALKSNDNELKIGKTIDKSHTIFVVFDQSLNLSKRMGIPIHGIIGYDFFKNLIVKTNYNAKKLTIYNPKTFQQKECKKCDSFDIIFQNNKPYITLNVTPFKKEEEVLLLVDSGSSDTIWLFGDTIFKENPEIKYFDDFLGQGLSGVIFGKRAKLKTLQMGKFKLESVKVAYPSKESMGNIKFFEKRNGSLGGDLLSRFTVLMDYPANRMVLKKNNKFKNGFYYNMSGLTLKHDGVVVVKNKKESFKDDPAGSKGATSITISTVYDFYLAPRFVISEIRENSPAALADIRVGDEVVSVNGKMAHNFKLFDLIGMFSSKIGKKITLKIKRDETIYRKKFTLKKLL